MNQYEELYHHTVRSVHRHIKWNYLTPFKQIFIPDREDHAMAFARPDLLQQIIDDISEDVWKVVDCMNI